MYVAAAGIKSLHFVVRGVFNTSRMASVWCRTFPTVLHVCSSSCPSASPSCCSRRSSVRGLRGAC
eukprot:6291565-Pyramimonas_sp.AAC.1